MRYFTIGKITGPQGIKGEVKVYPLTDDLRRFEQLEHIGLFFGGERRPLEVERARPHQNMVLVKFGGISDRAAAEALRGGQLKVPEDCLPPLDEDEYLAADLYDMEVVTTDGEILGRVEDILRTGANDVYAVRDERGNSILIPAIKDCVRHVDVPAKKMTVALLPGLREAVGAKEKK